MQNEETDCREIVCCDNSLWSYSSESPPPPPPSQPPACSKSVNSIPPTGGTLNLCRPVMFVVTASGAFGYQWQLDGVDIEGETSQNYIIPAATGLDAGTYTVTVFGDQDCEITSEDAVLAVLS